MWVAWSASFFVCVLPQCFMSFLENIRKIPRWQLGVTGGLLLWAAALQWHIRSVKPEFEEKFSDRLQREKAEADARQPPQLPGSRLSISFKPPDGSRRE